MQERTQNLESANAQLTRSSLDLDHFVYSALHDLRASIANLEGLLNELDRILTTHHPPPTELKSWLSIMHGAVQRVEQAIGHLTDILRAYEHLQK